MEAARRRDEAFSEAATSGVSTELQPEMFAGPAVFRKRDEADSEAATGVSAEPQPEMFAGPTAAPGGVAGTRPVVEEMLICSAQGEVWYQWQCRNVDLLVNVFEFISKRAQRLSKTLPLGQFDRLIIETAEVRAVVIIGVDRGVLVKTRKKRAA